MTKFSIIVDGTPFPLRVVGNMAWGGEQTVVVYESPGSNGGVVLVTGRKNQTRTLNGRILRGTDGRTPSEIKLQIERFRDAGKIVTLVTPLDEEGTGQYVISSFSGQVLEGIESYLPFTMELTEYRQANIKTSRVNAIAFQPSESIKKILNQREIG